MGLRDKVRDAARRVRRRIRGSGGRERGSERSPRVADGVIPPVQEGSGDTPGPNHPHDIGRTWASAQILGGEGVRVVDVRSPSEWVAGHLPGALLLPAEVAAAHTDLVGTPDDTTYVVVYDALVGDDAARVAAALRHAGWGRARRLVGGFAEWVEEGEEVVAPPLAHPLPIGATVDVPGGGSGVVWHRAHGQAWVVSADGVEARVALGEAG